MPTSDASALPKPRVYRFEPPPEVTGRPPLDDRPWICWNGVGTDEPDFETQAEAVAWALDDYAARVKAANHTEGD